MDYRTYEGVMEIFRSLNCIGNDNCTFLTFKNNTKDSLKYGAFGAVGGILMSNTPSSSNSAINGLENADGLLINQTERGFGIIPLSNKGIQLMLNAGNMNVDIQKFVFIPNEYIKEIIIKDFNIFNKKTQKVKIALNNGTTLDQIARINEKDIPYQQVNFSKFMSRYKR